MAVHVAILKREYVEMILRGQKTVESRLTKTRRDPFGTITPGERIYFKISAGPFAATAVAEAVACYDELTPTRLEKLKAKYNGGVCGPDAYWEMKRDSRYATFIALRQVEPVSSGPAYTPSQWRAWFRLEMPDPIARPDMGRGAARCSVEAELTGGAIRNRYVRLGRGSPIQTHDDAPTPITLVLPDGRQIDTVVKPDGMIRWRGWGPWIKSGQLRVGDHVRLEQTAPGTFAVTFVRPTP